MNTRTLKQVFFLALSTVILYYSGIYLISIGNIKSLFDGFIVMLFFFAFFPFVGITFLLFTKIYKSLLNKNNY
jgi:hypothetical protein